MTIYIYDSQTKELKGQRIARLDPVEGKTIIPANATDIEPPEASEGNVLVFDGEQWVEKKDNRGLKYYSPDFAEYEIENIGEEIPKGMLTKEEYEAAHAQHLKDTQWIKDRQAQYIAKGWENPYDLIEDILKRGIDTVKAEREQIKTDIPKGTS